MGTDPEGSVQFCKKGREALLPGPFFMAWVDLA